METNTVKRTSCNLTNIFRTWCSRFLVKDICIYGIEAEFSARERSPCSENDISKLWKYDVLKTEAEIAFYSVSIKEKD